MKRRSRNVLQLLLLILLVSIGFLREEFNLPEGKRQENAWPTPVVRELQEHPSDTASPPENKKTSAVVYKVIDGDTVVLSDGSHVRYIGIDAPEQPESKSAQCFAKESYEKNKELSEGKTVFLEKDVSEKDRYGRLLRYVYIDSRMVNEMLIREGFAKAVSYPPDTRYMSNLADAQRTAVKEEVGMWGTCKR